MRIDRQESDGIARIDADSQELTTISPKYFNSILAALPPLLVIYAVAFGGNVFGLLTDARKIVSLVLLALITLFVLRRHVSHPPAVIPLTVLTAAMCVSMLISPSTLGAWLVLIWAGVVITIWISAEIQAAQLERALMAVFAALALAALYDLFEWWFQNNLQLAEPLRPSSALTNPNIVAPVMMIGMALALYARHKAWLGVFAVVLAFTGSRAAFIGMGVGIAVLALLQLPRLRLARMHILAGAGLGIALLPLIIVQAGNSTHGSLDLRADLWRVAAISFFRSPLSGIGPEQYRVAFLELAQAQHGVDHVHAHNIYLQVAAEMGVLGMLTFIGIVAAAALHIWQTFRSGNRQGASIAAALMAGLLAHGMLDYVYWVLGLVLMVVWTGRVLLAPRPVSPAPVTQKPIKWGPGLTMMIALLGLPLVLLAHYLDYQSAVPYQYTTIAASLLACALYWPMAKNQLYLTHDTKQSF